jgi:hypothetical protein
MKRCHRCTVTSAHPDIKFDANGLCSECDTYDQLSETTTTQDNTSLIQELEQKFLQYRKTRGTYNVLVSYSGGADSSYLLYLLKEKYGLNPLAFSVIHPVVPELAQQNMKNITEALNIDLYQFQVNRNLYKEFMRYGLENCDRYDMGPDLLGCSFCAYLYKWIAYKTAILMNIPCFVEGVDKAQSGGWRFLTGDSIIPGASVKAEVEKRDKYYYLLTKIFEDAFGDKYKNSVYSCDFEELRDKKFPDIIKPFQILDYDSSKVAGILVKKSIIPHKDKLNFFLTNCDMGWFFTYVSFQKFGCHPYDKTYAAEFRTNKFSMLNRIFFNGENDDKASYLQFIDETHKVLQAVAKNKDLDSHAIGRLSEIAPLFYKKFRSKYSDAIVPELLKQMKSVHYYADYFGYAL